MIKTDFRDDETNNAHNIVRMSCRKANHFNWSDYLINLQTKNESREERITSLEKSEDNEPTVAKIFVRKIYIYQEPNKNEKISSRQKR